MPIRSSVSAVKAPVSEARRPLCDDPHQALGAFWNRHPVRVVRRLGAETDDHAREPDRVEEGRPVPEIKLLAQEVGGTDDDDVEGGFD